MIKATRWDGKQVSKPGIYSAMPLEAYHAHDICVGPSISSSGMRSIFGERASPKKFFSQWSGNPHRVIKPPGQHFVIGRALHHLILGEAFFAKLFCIRPHELPDEHGELKPWNGNRRVCQRWLAKRTAEGRAILSPSDAHMLKMMAIAVENHPLVKAGALNGQIERSLFWRDKETGVWLKSRPDAIPTASADYTDLKTARSVYWPDLMHAITEYGYYGQVALVREASERVLEMPMASFTYLFVEKADPWHCRDVRVDEQDIERGHLANRAAIRIFARCVREKRWPGEGDGNEGNERIALSPAARERLDTKLKYEGLDT